MSTRPISSSKINDLVVIDGAGAYCSSMSAKNYNSFPEAPEVLLKHNGTIALIRRYRANSSACNFCLIFEYRKQTLDQIVSNEVSPEEVKWDS